MNKFFTLLLFAFFTIASGITFSQIELPEDKVKATISLKQEDCSLEVVVDVDIVDGWHINSHVLPEGSFSIPTNITVDKSNNYKSRDGIIEPKPILEFDEMADEMMSYHHHKFTLKKKITSKARKDYVLKGVFSFQTCNEAKCLPPYEQPFELKVKACGPVMELRDDIEPAAETNGPDDNLAFQEFANEKRKEIYLGPHNLRSFRDYDKALEYAQKTKKPLFVDFTGWACVNCRKMEQSVWRKPGIIERLKNDVVIVSLYVDDKTELPLDEQTTVNLYGRKIDVRTIGNKWSAKQMRDYKTNTQPYYIMQSSDGVDLNNGAADYQNHSNPYKFKDWLEAGLNENKKLVSNE